MRELTVAEKFSQIVTIEKQRRDFMINNTSTMPNHEYVNGEWVKVFAIRYTGATGTKNVWGL